MGRAEQLLQVLWQHLESGQPARAVSRSVCDHGADSVYSLLASKGHLNAILAIKGNLPSSEVRSIRNILDINTGMQEPPRPLFSLIKLA